MPGPAVPLLPTDGPRSDAVQPPAPQFHKAAKTKSAYENVVDLDEEQLRGISLTALLAGGAQLFARHGAAAREDPRGTYALSRPVGTVVCTLADTVQRTETTTVKLGW